MRAEVGKELERVEHRLADISFLAECTRPVEGKEADYPAAVLAMIARAATEAKLYLAIAISRRNSQ